MVHLPARARDHDVDSDVGARALKHPPMSIVAVVPMPVVRIGHVDVRMIERVVNVGVDVRFGAVQVGFVRVLMMRVVPVRVRVTQHLVNVPVAMALGHVQPDTQRHQHAREADGERERFVLDGDRVERAKERRDRVVGSGARRPEVAQRKDEQREADAISCESERKRRYGRRSKPEAKPDRWLRSS